MPARRAGSVRPLHSGRAQCPGRRRRRCAADRAERPPAHAPDGAEEPVRAPPPTHAGIGGSEDGERQAARVADGVRSRIRSVQGASSGGFPSVAWTTSADNPARLGCRRPLSPRRVANVNDYDLIPVDPIVNPAWVWSAPECEDAAPIRPPALVRKYWSAPLW